MGAYSLVTATEFNFFRKAEVVVLNDALECQAGNSLKLG